MIFAHESIELIKIGLKTQTRRPKEYDKSGGVSWPMGTVKVVPGKNGRVKWEVGRTYAINPPSPPGSNARCGKSVGRIRIISIRCQRVEEISDEDAIAEGVCPHGDKDGRIEGYSFSMRGETVTASTPREAFLKGWKLLYPKSDLTELVWALEFELVSEES